MTPIPPFPGTQQSIAQADRRASEVYARFFDQLVKVLNERDALIAAQADHIETLRVALNEARTNPTTIYPPVPAF